MLPLGPVGYGNSPYSCTSAFAGNVLMISLERLAERGYLDPARLAGLPDGDSASILRASARRSFRCCARRPATFSQGNDPLARQRYDAFCFRKQVVAGRLRAVQRAARTLRRPSLELMARGNCHAHPDALEQLHSDLKDQLALERFLQFAFFEQWKALRAYCAERGIRIIGDVAIFVSYDSADVWTHPDIFRLREDLSPEVVAGVPPDAFSATGQRWGNPLYDWDALKARGYDWWIERMRWAVETCDIVRLDHFRGFEACWEIPADEPTADQRPLGRGSE